MDKSFDGMHEKYDFDSIRFSVKKTISISISMIVTSVDVIEMLYGFLFINENCKQHINDRLPKINVM